MISFFLWFSRCFQKTDFCLIPVCMLLLTYIGHASTLSHLTPGNVGFLGDGVMSRSWRWLSGLGLWDGEILPKLFLRLQTIEHLLRMGQKAHRARSDHVLLEEPSLEAIIVELYSRIIWVLWSSWRICSHPDQDQSQAVLVLLLHFSTVKVLLAHEVLQVVCHPGAG